MKEKKESLWVKRYHFEVTDSTNEQAKKLAWEGAPHGTLITADTQTSGKGRRGRSWESEEQNGIYMSFILKPKILPQNASMLTLVTASSVSLAIQKQLKKEGIISYIKWPNDIVMNQKKICGILTEMELKQGEIAHIIVGIGINVNQKKFPKEIDIASSIFLETGQILEKEELIQEILRCFEEKYTIFLKTEDLTELKQEYESLLINKEKRVTVLEPKGSWEGIARGITNKGELIIDTENGVQYVSSGEVSVRGVYGYV